MNKNKLIFWILYTVILLLVPITILPGVDYSFTLAHPAVLTNLIQRILGLTAFTLIFWQVMIGSNMAWLTSRLGGWLLKFHIGEGITIYSIVLAHPITFLLLRYFEGKGIDPFYIFLDFCLLCQSPAEFYYTLGRVAFWLLNIAVFAGLFRFATPYMRANWKKFHVLNYVVFLLAGIHGFSIGSDFMQMPYFAFAILAYIIVLYIVVFRKIPELIQNLRRQLT